MKYHINTNDLELRTKIGKTLQEARKEANLDQIAAGKRIGKTGDFVSNSELGKRKVTIYDIALFSTAYKKDLFNECKYLLADFSKENTKYYKK